MHQLRSHRCIRGRGQADGIRDVIKQGSADQLASLAAGTNSQGPVDYSFTEEPPAGLISPANEFFQCE